MQLLEGNCSAVLCWPLTLINTNQPQVYICPLHYLIIIKKLENTVAQKEKLIQITLEPPIWR